MTRLLFLRASKLLRIVEGAVGSPNEFPAANNVDSRSNGPWPRGTWDFAWYDAMPGDPPQSAYGSHGILIFEVPGREGMGVHAGRQGVADGLGRSGFEHCTMGCIRTTEDAMSHLLIAHALQPIASIEVTDG